jgi:signal transduction histidine kinase
VWKKGEVSPIPLLVAAMILVAAAFVSAMMYFEASTRRVSRETEGMLRSGVPSADQLNRVRAALRQLDSAFDAALRDCMQRRPLDRTRLVEARDHLLQELAEYRVYPYYRFEEDLNLDLDRELVRLQEVMQRVIDQMAAGHLQKAMELENRDWREESDRVDDRLSGLIAFNIRHVTDHALRIEHVRRRAALVGFTAGGLSLLVAFAATIVAVMAVRRRLRLQADRAMELEMFASRVAHDLMSPLTSVALSLELGRGEAKGEQLPRFINRALASTKRMRSIVDGLLDFARAGGQPPPGSRCQPAAVVQVVLEQSRNSAEQGNIELLSEACECEVACSAAILTVVLTNLVDNAIKYMGEAKERRILVRVSARMNDCVRFEVADSGPGLPHGFETHAFQPYARGSTRLPGLGLGLATVKRLVLAYGGRVGVSRGASGVGALFWFELPRPES